MFHHLPIITSRYFRQLQEISDSVVEVQWDGAVSDAIKENETTRVELEKKINTARARHRYLNHLANKEGEGGEDDEEDACILCKCEFVRGYITQWLVPPCILHSPGSPG